MEFAIFAKQLIKMYDIDYLKTHVPLGSLLTPISFSQSISYTKGHPTKMVLCMCECGKSTIITMWKFLRGHTKSCGCFRKKVLLERVSKYYPVIKDLREAYYSMIGRCYDVNHQSYKNYGAKGVVVCDEWRNNYQAFLDWSLGNGWGKGLELDKDIKGDGMLYNPSNCSWVSREENQNNRKDCVKYNYNNDSFTLSQFSRKYNINRNTLEKRIRNGWDIKRALETPVNLKYKSKQDVKQGPHF